MIGRSIEPGSATQPAESTCHGIGTLIDRRRPGLMRGDAWLINAARGGLIDEEKLIEALAAGRITGAGLDVYLDEREVDPKLLDLPNVVLFPSRIGDDREPDGHGKRSSRTSLHSPRTGTVGQPVSPVIARSEATKQSRRRAGRERCLDYFASLE